MNLLAVVMIVGVAVSCTIAYLLMFDERTKNESPDQQSVTKRVLESRSTSLNGYNRQTVVQPGSIQTNPQDTSRSEAILVSGRVEIDEENSQVVKARDNVRAMADNQPERVVAILRRWLSEDDRKFR